MLDLLNAVLKGNHNLVQAILNKNPPQSHLNQALLNAAGNGRLVMVRKLLNKGANINHKNNTNLSPLISASIGGYTNVAKELLNRGASRNGLALHHAIIFRQIPMIKLLILHGVPVKQEHLMLTRNRRVTNAIEEATKNLRRRQGLAVVAVGNVRSGNPRPSNRNLPRPLIREIMRMAFPK